MITSVQIQTIRKHHFEHSLCHTCNPPSIIISKGEIAVGDFFVEHDIHVIRNDTNLLNGLEVDIYLPEYNLAIEYNGLYYHSSKMGYDINKHKNKTDMLWNNHNIQLIHLFDSDWSQRNDIVKSVLLSKVNKTMSIGARQCEIVELSTTEANTLISQWHLQGPAIGATHRYGLKYNNEIVSIMTFSKQRVVMKSKTHDDNTFELLRFCNKPYINVIGGASRLFKHFIKAASPSKIISYADRFWVNQGSNVYTSLGFSLVERNITMGYFYTDFTNKYHRYAFRKTNEMGNMTEEDYWATKGFYRVYDSGQLLYEYIT